MTKSSRMPSSVVVRTVMPPSTEAVLPVALTPSPSVASTAAPVTSQEIQQLFIQRPSSLRPNQPHIVRLVKTSQVPIDHVWSVLMILRFGFLFNFSSSTFVKFLCDETQVGRGRNVLHKINGWFILFNFHQDTLQCGCFLFHPLPCHFCSVLHYYEVRLGQNYLSHGDSVWMVTWNCSSSILNGQYSGLCGGTSYMGQTFDPSLAWNKWTF